MKDLNSTMLQHAVFTLSIETFNQLSSTLSISYHGQIPERISLLLSLFSEIESLNIQSALLKVDELLKFIQEDTYLSYSKHEDRPSLDIKHSLSKYTVLLIYCILIKEGRVGEGIKLVRGWNIHSSLLESTLRGDKPQLQMVREEIIGIVFYDIFRCKLSKLSSLCRYKNLLDDEK